MKQPHTPGSRVDLPGQLEIEVLATVANHMALFRLKSAAPLRPSKPQMPCDHGLFSDEAAQLDLVEMLQEPTNE